MKVAIYPIENNKVAVLLPVDTSKPIEEIAANCLGEKHYTITDELNMDYEFQEAYEYLIDPITNKGSAVLNYDKAKEIQKNKWRILRKPILEKMDISFMKSLETGDVNQMKDIATQKQDLRDITNTPLINNLDSIKETIPNILKTL